MLEPFGWSVVIPGAWNCAILTPAGIAKHIFQLDGFENLEVHMPLNAVDGFRVKHPERDVLIHVSATHLRVLPTLTTWETLQNSMQLGITALKALPLTPVSAAGFNVKFKAADTPDQLIGVLESSADETLNELELTISQRGVSRQLPSGEGVLNLAFGNGDSGCEVSFNFHRGSASHEELENWLDTPIDEVRECVSSVLGALGLAWDKGECDG